MGIVSCLGNTVEDVASSLHECKSGITFSEKYDEIGMKSKVCGTPNIDADGLIDRKQLRFMGNNCKYAFLAMEQAIADSGLTTEQFVDKVAEMLAARVTPQPAKAAKPVDAPNVDEDAMASLFAELDTDGNGFIDYEELKAGLRKLGVQPRKMLEKSYADV